MCLSRGPAAHPGGHRSLAAATAAPSAEKGMDDPGCEGFTALADARHRGQRRL